MTKLLNRGNVFVITRTDYDWENTRKVVIGVFSEFDEADDYKGMCEQQWKERVGNLYNVEFEIVLTTYYGK